VLGSATGLATPHLLVCLAPWLENYAGGAQTCRALVGPGGLLGPHPACSWCHEDSVAVTAELSAVHLRVYQRGTMVDDFLCVKVMCDGKSVLAPHTAIVEAGESVMQFVRRLLPAMPRVSLDGMRIDAFSTKPADKNVPRCKFGHLDAGIRSQMNAVDTTHVEFELYSPKPSTHPASKSDADIKAFGERRLQRL
jgi:hypothetical protein